jgi:hypothetical protein
MARIRKFQVIPTERPQFIDARKAKSVLIMKRVICSMALLAGCSLLSVAAAEPGAETDNARRSAYHQKRAAMLRQESAKYAERSKMKDCPSDKAKACVEMASVMKKMADLNDQAAEALKKNDQDTYLAEGRKFKELDARRSDLYRQLKEAMAREKNNGAPSDSSPGHGEGKKSAPSSSPAESSGNSSAKSSAPSESEVRQWLGEGSAKQDKRKE